MAQPVVYVGFWITATSMILGLAGASLGSLIKPEIAAFQIRAFKGWNPQLGPAGAAAPDRTDAAIPNQANRAVDVPRHGH